MNPPLPLALQATQLALHWPPHAAHELCKLFAGVLGCQKAMVWVPVHSSGRLVLLDHWELNLKEATHFAEWNPGPSSLASHALNNGGLQWTVGSRGLSAQEGLLCQQLQLSSLICAALEMPDGTCGFLYAGDGTAVIPDTGQLMAAVQVAQSMTVGLYQQALQKQFLQSQKRLDRVMARSLDLILTTRGSQITSISDSCHPILGYLKDELLGKDFLTLIDPEDLEATWQAAQSLQSAPDLVMFENRYLHKDGHVVHLEWNAVLEGEEFIAVARDVTGRKQKDQYLQLLSSAIEQARDMMIITDAQLESPGPFIQYVNRAFEQATGFSREQVMGQSPRILQGPDTDRVVLERMKTALSNQQPFQCELINYTREGKPYWTELHLTPIVNARGETTHFVSMQRDITERVQAKAKLEEIAGAFEQLFHSNPLPMWVFDRESLRFLEVNEAAVRKYGHSRAAFLQLTLLDIRPPEDQAPLLRLLKEQEHLPFHPPRGFVHLTATGERMEVEVSSHDLTHFRHRARLAVVFDVTERNRVLRELSDARSNLQTITENTVNMITVFDGQLNRVYASPSCERVVGYTPEELPMLSEGNVHPEDQPQIKTQVEAALQAGQDTLVLEYRLRHKAGHFVWVESAFKFLRSPEGQFEGMILTTLPIQDRITAREKARLALQQANQLLELMVSLEGVHDLQDVIEVAIKHSLNCLPFDVAAFMDVKSGMPITVMGAPTEKHQRAFKQKLQTLLHSPALQQLLTAQKPFEVTEEGVEVCTEGHQVPPGSHLYTPILQEGQLYGVLVLTHTQNRIEITPLILQVLTAIRDRIAHAMERTRHLQGITTSREETLRTLGLALEYRDYETKGHTDRVMHLSMKLGQQLGLTDEQLNALRWGAYLHDIGKMAIGDHILLKPSNLSPEERQVIQTHSRIGFEMLSHIPNLPEETLQLVLHHHERWDGRGYPGELKGENIPLLARVFSVVDVYDALVSQRPYKKPMAHQDALAEIQRCSGSMFDPQVVAAFSALGLEGMQGP